MLAILDGDVAGSRRPKIRAFELALALVMWVEPWCRALVLWDEMSTADFTHLAISTVLAPAAFWPPTRRTAFAGLALNQIFVVAWDYPFAGNHAYLEAILCALAAVIDPREEADRVLFLRSLRWIGVVVLFSSGLHKLIQGYYFSGEFLAYALWGESFRPVLQVFMPDGEFTRLVALKGAVGDGPYAVASPLFVLLSNSVWALEMATAVLLIPRSTRPIAVGAGLALVLAFEIAAREVFFGILFANLLLLHLPGRPSVMRPAAFALLLGYLLAVRLGVGPSWSFY